MFPGESAIFCSFMCDVLLCFCHFPMWCPWPGWYLIVSISDLCLLTYFFFYNMNTMIKTSLSLESVKYVAKLFSAVKLQMHFTNYFSNEWKSELPQPIPQNSVESDHGCTSRIYFDNAGDNVTLTLYNVTLTSQKLC